MSMTSPVSPLAPTAGSVPGLEVGQFEDTADQGTTDPSSYNREMPTPLQPNDEEDMKKYLTTDQQAVLFEELFGEGVQEEEPPPQNPPSYNVDMGASLSGSRAAAALFDARTLANANLASLGAGAAVDMELRNAYYAEQGRSTEDQIESDYENRGVLESSDHRMAQADALRMLHANKSYNDLRAQSELQAATANIQQQILQSTRRTALNFADEGYAYIRELINLTSQAGIGSPASTAANTDLRTYATPEDLTPPTEPRRTWPFDPGAGGRGGRSGTGAR